MLLYALHIVYFSLLNNVEYRITVTFHSYDILHVLFYREESPNSRIYCSYCYHINPLSASVAFIVVPLFSYHFLLI